jgi:iron complex outermembrane recepter protein
MRILFILFFLSTGFAVLAQDCSYKLRGQVLDDEDQPLQGAVIELSVSRDKTVSLKDGSFLFSNLCAGKQVVSVQYVGFALSTKTVHVGNKSLITFRLRADETQLAEVVVQSDAAKRNFSQTSALLSETEVLEMHGKPLGESLLQIAGVSALQTGPSIFKPMIHGLHSQRILILNNGIRQEGQQWGTEHAPEIDPFIATQIEVVKGAEAVRYGADALGGAIIITPPSLHKSNGFGGTASSSFLTNSRTYAFSAMLEGNIRALSKWAWRTQGTYKRGGDYHTPDYVLSNTGLQEYNFSGAIGFNDHQKGVEIYGSTYNTKIGILRAAHTGNLSDLQASIVNERPWYVRDFTYNVDNPYQEIHHNLLKVKAFEKIEGVGTLTILYGGQLNQRNEFDIRRAGRSNRPALSLALFSNVVDVSLDHEWGDVTGSVGVNGTFKENKNDTEATGIKPLIPNYNQYAGGLFWIEKWRKGNWTLEAGARYDYQFLKVLTFTEAQELVKPVFEFNYFSGSAGVTYSFTPNTRIVSNLSLASRPPHVSELYSEGLHHGTASIEEGLKRLNGVLNTETSGIKKEFSRKWITSLQHAGTKFSVEVSAYANVIDNYVFLSPSATRLTIRGYFPVFSYQQTNALLTGADATVGLNVSKQLFFQGKYSYLYGKDVSRNDVLIFMPPPQFDNSITYTFAQTNNFKNVHVTARSLTVLEQTRAPRAVYPVDIVNYNNDGVIDFMPAPNAYTLIHLQAGFDLPVGEHSLSVNIACENLLNTRYRNYLNRLRYYADDIGQNFIIRLSYNFYSH